MTLVAINKGQIKFELGRIGQALMFILLTKFIAADWIFSVVQSFDIFWLVKHG